MIETFVANLAGMLPFGLAFGAGMATTVSPCGIAMLPAYVSLFLGAREEGFWDRSPINRGARALALSGVVTLGFVAFFGSMGAVLMLGVKFITDFKPWVGVVMPWVAVAIGVALIMLGIYLLAGGHVYTNLPSRLAARLGNPGGTSILGFLVFGIAYGIAALSCTFPVFMYVVGSSLVDLSDPWFDPWFGLLQFVRYALGMGFAIAMVTLGSALFKEAVNRWLRRLVPVVARLSPLLLIFAGGYILYFWFVVGDILNWTFN